MAGYNIKLPDITSYYDLVNQYQKRRNGLTGLAGINIGKPIYKPPTTSPTPSPGTTLPGSPDQYLKLQANALQDFKIPKMQQASSEEEGRIAPEIPAPPPMASKTKTQTEEPPAPPEEETQTEEPPAPPEEETTPPADEFPSNDIVGVFYSTTSGETAYVDAEGNVYHTEKGLIGTLQGNKIYDFEGNVIGQILPGGTYVTPWGQGVFTDVTQTQPELNIPTDVYSTSTSSSSSGLPPQLLSLLTDMIETLKPLTQKYADYMNWLSSPGLFIEESKRMMKNVLEPLYDTLAKRGLVDSSVKEEALEKAAEMIPQMYLAERMDIADLLRQAVALPFAGMAYGRESISESLTEHPLEPYQLMAQLLLAS